MVFFDALLRYIIIIVTINVSCILYRYKVKELHRYGLMKDLSLTNPCVKHHEIWLKTFYIKSQVKTKMKTSMNMKHSKSNRLTNAHAYI